MLNDAEITYSWNADAPDERGAALAFIIDEDVVYDAPFYNWAATLFLTATNFEDVSSEYPDHQGIVVRFFENDTPIEDLATSEYFGSILLSDPVIKDLNAYPYGRYVISPNAKFIDNEFVILGRPVDGMPPFITEEEIAAKIEAYNSNNG